MLALLRWLMAVVLVIMNADLGTFLGHFSRSKDVIYDMETFEIVFSKSSL